MLGTTSGNPGGTLRSSVYIYRPKRLLWIVVLHGAWCGGSTQLLCAGDLGAWNGPFKIRGFRSSPAWLNGEHVESAVIGLMAWFGSRPLQDSRTRCVMRVAR